MENPNINQENENSIAMIKETIIIPESNADVVINDHQETQIEIEKNNNNNEQNEEEEKSADRADDVEKPIRKENEIDINITIEVKNQSINSLETNAKNNQSDDAENIKSINFDNNKDNYELGVNPGHLDKLFSSTQQQKSIQKEIDDKIEIKQIDKGSSRKEEEKTQNTVNENSNDHINNTTTDQQNLVLNKFTGQNDSTLQNETNQSLNHNNTTKLSLNTELPKDPNTTIINSENYKLMNNDISSSSSSYYSDEEELNLNNNIPINLTSNISNNQNINNPNDNLSLPNKTNFSTLNPIFIHNVPKEIDDGIPPALKPLIFHAKDSLTYQALCGKQIHGLKQSALTSIVNDLRKYVDIAVDHNLINEACHIQMCIDNIRNDHSAEKIQADKEIVEIDKKLQEANQELEERMNFWKNQEYTIQKEFEMQITDLMINKDQALSDLDNEWQSPKKQQLYSKPSPALLNMRHMAKKMIRTQQFEEVKKLARLIEIKEKEEIDEAAKRMNEDYHIADQRLNEHFDHEQHIIQSMHEMKMHNLTRSKEQNLRPLYQRIENLQKMKEQAHKVQKKASQLVVASTPRKRGSNSISTSSTPRYLAGKPSSRIGRATSNSNANPQKQLPQLLVTPKLALPPVKRINREGAKSQIGQTSSAISNQSIQNQNQQQNQNQNQQQQQPSLYRPKALSRLSNPAAEKNSSRKNAISPKYH